MSSRDAAQSRVERELFIRERLTRLAEPGLAPLVASFAEEVTFAPGAVIYRAGEPARDFYAFVRGEFQIAVEGTPPWTLKDQSGMGHFEVLADRPRISTVTAVTQVRAMRVSAADYLDFLEEHFEFVAAAVQGVTQDVHELSLQLAPDGGFAAITHPGAPPTSKRSAPMNLVEKLEALRASHVFRKANVQALVRLATLAREIDLDAGGVLFGRGGAASKFFLVAEGVIEATREAPDLVARFGRGDLVCGLGALGAADDDYTAVALSPAAAFSFSEEDLFDVMEEHFDLTRSVLASIASDYQRLLLERARRISKGAR